MQATLTGTDLREQVLRQRLLLVSKMEFAMPISTAYQTILLTHTTPTKLYLHMM